MAVELLSFRRTKDLKDEGGSGGMDPHIRVRPMSSRDHGDPFSMSGAEMRRLGHKVVDLLVDHYQQLPEQAVTTPAKEDYSGAVLGDGFGERGLPADLVVEGVMHNVLRRAMPVNHPRFFAYIPGPGNFMGMLADTIAAGGNMFCGVAQQNAGPTQVENEVLDWLCELFDLPPEAAGCLVSGGSVANMSALIVARDQMLGERRDKAVLYCSDQTHGCVAKAARLLGFREDQLSIIPSDGQYRLRMDVLTAEVMADRARGRQPFCVVATAGTTSTGAVDPLEQIADLCEEQDLWFHVDAAYGGAAMLTAGGRVQLRGIERAQSLALDPHKGLFQPMECGCLLVRQREWLGQSFRIEGAYLLDNERADGAINYRDRGVQLTRNFKALKLWMSLKTYGVAVFRDAVQKGMDLAVYGASALSEIGNCQIMAPPVMGIVVFRLRATGDKEDEAADNQLNQQLHDFLQEEGYAFLSTTMLSGRKCLRLCPINPRTTTEDIQRTVERIGRFAAERARAPGQERPELIKIIQTDVDSRGGLGDAADRDAINAGAGNVPDGF
ncbi:MAG: decarboxylase [Kordiimonas sp.]|nr:decarboxylase [Kordiimonas sp.]|tara:strand:+ start:444 stop:2102 length:1659 start_codon:yes stop_codon:yes gene_type:complete